MTTKNAIPLATIVVASLVWLSVAHAQVSTSVHALPMSLAVEAATEAVQACSAKGYAVTATVVDVAGNPQVVLRGDRAAVHTKDSSYRKAYTAASMGAVFHVDRTSQFLDLLSKAPPLVAQSLISTPNVTALPGGAAIKIDNEIIAGIGVGGSPGGDKDEACALAGIAKIQDRLPH